MKIAVVGGGVAGLVAAAILGKDHSVTLLEAGSYLGGHTNTVAVSDPSGSLPIDTGFIVHNPHYYPNFSRLLEILRVETQDAPMGFSLRHDREGIEYSGASLGGLFAQPRNMINPRFLGMISDILRFHRDHAGVGAPADDWESVETYAARMGFGAEFLEWFLVPLGSALWSSPLRRFREFPIQFVIDFLAHHGMMQIRNRPPWKVIRGGSRTYVDRLVERMSAQIRLNTAVKRISRTPEGVLIECSPGPAEEFDEAIVACHADQALRMLSEPDGAEVEILSCFPFQRNDAILHTDTSLLPRRRSAWACWNYLLTGEEADGALVTYNMNLLQSISSDTVYCVSLNARNIDPARVLRRIVYHHPVFLPGRKKVQSRHTELIRRRGISYCGAYWGFGFHEDGVRSALAVCREFGAGLDRLS